MIVLTIGILVLILVCIIGVKIMQLLYCKSCRQKNELKLYGQVRTSVALLHPYCNSGGGGEKVLMSMLFKLQKQDEYSVVVYSGESVSDQEILDKTLNRFNIQIQLNIQFIRILQTHLLQPARRFTMLFQILGQMLYAYYCINQYQPDILIDSTGLPFTYFVFKVLMPSIRIVSYVHYPFISSDMIASVSSGKQSYNNQQDIAKSKSITLIKLVYYRILLLFYKQCGRCISKVYCNSSWTKSHIKQIWNNQKIYKLFPPCTVEPFIERRQIMDRRNNEFVIVSFAQYRPEKQHKLQIEIMKELINKLPEEIGQYIRLNILGAVRNSDDEQLFENLQKQVIEYKLQDHIKLYKNLPYPEVIKQLTQSTIGLHTMEYEHFGISLVEMLAAGLIVVAHNSAGPKMDILADEIGFLCENIEDYVFSIVRILQMDDEDRQQYVEDGQDRAREFSDESFQEQFIL